MELVLELFFLNLVSSVDNLLCVVEGIHLLLQLDSWLQLVVNHFLVESDFFGGDSRLEGRVVEGRFYLLYLLL